MAVERNAREIKSKNKILLETWRK